MYLHDCEVGEAWKIKHLSPQTLIISCFTFINFARWTKVIFTAYIYPCLVLDILSLRSLIRFCWYEAVRFQTFFSLRIYNTNMFVSKHKILKVLTFFRHLFTSFYNSYWLSYCLHNTYFCLKYFLYIFVAKTSYFKTI